MDALEIAVGVWSAVVLLSVAMVSIDNLKSGDELSETARIAGLVSLFGLTWFIARLMGAA